MFYPSKDLRFRNENEEAIQLELKIEDGSLIGRVRSEKPCTKVWRICEVDRSFKKVDDRWVRSNIVVRVMVEDGAESSPEVVAENIAVCLYDPEQTHASRS